MKKLLCAALATMFSFTLVGCGETYEDTNGEDNFALQTITDENIIKQNIGASGLSYSETEIGPITTSEYSAKNFNGVECIYETTYIGKSDVTVYVGTMNVKSGNFKMAVVLDDEIIKEIPLDAFGEDFYFEDIKGHFQLVVAGESAAVEFYVNVE